MKTVYDLVRHHTSSEMLCGSSAILSNCLVNLMN